ncbi:membrane protein insertion efficiency factor YidD [Desulfonema magnum]|nr:membrane protein insertion efficiency factor YidD [Desulfonema magnum]
MPETLFLFFIVLFPALSPAGQLDLATDLFEERNWRACRTECSRVLLACPGHEKAVLLRAVSELRSGKDSTKSLRLLCESPDTSPETAVIAHYELGRALWKSGEPEKAFLHLKKAFENSRSGNLFLRAGCSLSLLLKQHSELAEDSSGLQMQLKSCSPLWSREIRAECAISPRGESGSWTGKPGQWLISFYRSQISPAIGQRCSLNPTCSEYARQALRKHGILGLGFIGDRLVREPDVVAEKKSPVRINGRWRYRDPLKEHDDWMK